MAELSNLNRPKPVTATIDLGDGDLIGITFDRNRMTSAWDERVKTERGFADGLAEVIMSWDVEENGQRLDASAANIARLSIPAQAVLFEQLVQASLPSRAEGEASSGRSSTPASDSVQQPATPPNGQTPSPSHLPSVSPSTT